MKLALYLLFFISTAFGNLSDPAPGFYRDIVDICHPTLMELRILQDRLLNTPRPILKNLGEIEFISKQFKLLSDNPNELPESGFLAVNSPENERKNCIVIYASFNQRYPQGVKRLVKALAKSDYKGHIYYQIGSWPNLENGDLRLAHVPFAFKACFLKEMQKKGYEKALWLDSSLLPVPGISLNFIFDMIDRLGLFIQAGDHTIAKYMNLESAAAFGLTLDQASPILSCSAAFIGINFKNRQIVSLLDAWYKAAGHPYAFFSGRADQNALSILIHQMGLREDMLPRKLIGSTTDYSGAFFLMDRTFVKDESPN